MRPNGSPLDFASITDIRMTAVRARPEYTLTLEPYGRITRYAKQTELDSDNVFVNASGTRRFERHRLDGSFRYQQETTLTTERTDSGNLERNLQRTLMGGDASWQYFLSSVLSVTASGGMTDVKFEKTLSAQFVDYRQSNAALNVEYEFSEATSVFMRPAVSRFETPDLMSETVSYTYQLGF
ncbi:MAG: hypothetical protein RLN70_01585, partial [Rhodospirillaceae bacterium]